MTPTPPPERLPGEVAYAATRYGVCAVCARGTAPRDPLFGPPRGGVARHTACPPSEGYRERYEDWVRTQRAPPEEAARRRIIRTAAVLLDLPEYADLRQAMLRRLLAPPPVPAPPPPPPPDPEAVAARRHLRLVQ